MQKYFKYLLWLLWLIGIGGYVLSFFHQTGLILLSVGALTLSLIYIFKFKKLKILIFTLLGLIALEFFYAWYHYLMFQGDFERLMIFFMVMPLVSIRYIFSIKNFGIVFLGMMGLFTLGVIVKYLHQPLGIEMLTISIGMITIIFLIQMFYSFTFLDNNKLLWIISLVCNFIMAHFFVGLLLKRLHGPGGNFFYNNTEHFLPAAFVICSVILLIGIQITDFTKWLEAQRKQFPGIWVIMN